MDAEIGLKIGKAFNTRFNLTLQTSLVVG